MTTVQSILFGNLLSDKKSRWVFLVQILYWHFFIINEILTCHPYGITEYFRIRSGAENTALVPLNPDRFFLSSVLMLTFLIR